MITISPELQTRLLALAEAKGLTVDAYIELLLSEDAETEERRARDERTSDDVRTDPEEGGGEYGRKYFERMSGQVLKDPNLKT